MRQTDDGQLSVEFLLELDLEYQCVASLARSVDGGTGSRGACWCSDLSSCSSVWHQ